MSIVLDRLREFWWCLIDDDCIDIPLTEVNQLNVFGENPIHIAAWRGSPEDVRWLIDNGANLNAFGDFGMTPLHYAYMGRKPENVEALLTLGADPKIRCDWGLLPSESASKPT